MTGIKINPNHAKLAASYLFKDIGDKTGAFVKANPNQEVFRMGIGNTTLPLSQTVGNAMIKRTQELMTQKGYSGYGDEVAKEFIRFVRETGRQLHLEIDPGTYLVAQAGGNSGTN